MGRFLQAVLGNLDSEPELHLGMLEMCPWEQRYLSERLQMQEAFGADQEIQESLLLELCDHDTVSACFLMWNLRISDMTATEQSDFYFKHWSHCMNLDKIWGLDGSLQQILSSVVLF